MKMRTSVKCACVLLIGSATLVLGTAPGCRKTAPPPEPPPPAVEVEVSPQERAAMLSQRVERFAREVAKLPGRDQQEYRRMMADRFGDLAEILPMLEGPEPGGAFRQQVRIIENTRATLQSAPEELALEPTVGLGLRAAENALSGVQARTFYANQEVADALEPLRSRIADLDAARGPLNQLVAAQSMREIANVLTRMSLVVHGRADAEQQRQQDSSPATQPVP